MRGIGNTPLLSLSHLEQDVPGVRLFAKAEWYNPGGSVKDRAASSMIADAEASGRLRGHVTLLDATSGNTGVAYAMIGAAKGYRVALCVPKNANAEVLGLLRAYGAEVILTDPLQGSDGAIQEARRLAAERPTQFLYLDQYNNPANWRAHYRTTAAEIWDQTRGTVTHFIAGLGTTGTFIGTSRRLKELNPGIRTIAVQPDAAFHGLEGLKHLESAIVPGIYDPSVPDEVAFISTESAYDAVKLLTEREGILVGPSGGAALAAGLRLSRRLSSSQPSSSRSGLPSTSRRGPGPWPAGSAALPVGFHTPATIVMIFPDAGARYVSEGLLSVQRSGAFSS